MAAGEIQIDELRHDGTVVLLDVRSQDEYTAGHVPGAVNVPLGELDAVAGRYAGREVVTVCHSGSRSLTAAGVLAAAGARVRSLAGGTEAWRRAGRPVETGR